MANTQFKSPLQSPATDPDNFNVEDLDKRLKLAQLLELEDLLAKKAEEKRQNELSRKAGIDAVWQQMAMQKRSQDGCSHMKENGSTHLAGQKDHSGTIVLLCQKCQKVFRGNQIPPHLFPHREGAIGGPH